MKTLIVLKTILEFSKKETIKLKDDVKERGVIFLNDSGETDNFIHHEITDELALPITEETRFGVTI